MIPASYLYKDIYRQTWLNPDIESAMERDRARRDGGRTIWSGLRRLLSGLKTPDQNVRPVAGVADTACT